MGKNVRTKVKGMQRSDIPYKDRLMVNQFANIAQHRESLNPKTIVREE